MEALDLRIIWFQQN
nr:unnamed protein product [Callosobruchus chinensis]